MQYTIVSGDTLSGIAQRLCGSASLWRAIAKANDISTARVDRLIPDEKLTIPDELLRRDILTQIMADAAANAAKPHAPALTLDQQLLLYEDELCAIWPPERHAYHTISINPPRRMGGIQNWHVSSQAKSGWIIGSGATLEAAFEDCKASLIEAGVTRWPTARHTAAEYPNEVQGKTRSIAPGH